MRGVCIFGYWSAINYLIDPSDEIFENIENSTVFECFEGEAIRTSIYANDRAFRVVCPKTTTFEL